MKIEGDVIRGIVRSDGRDIRKEAHQYMSSPPSMPCSEILCPVQSWIAKSGGDIPGAAVGDWAVALRVKDRSLLDGLQSGQQTIEIGKNAKGLIEFNIKNVKKCMKVNKKMSKPSAAEQIDGLANNLIQKANGSLDPVSARVQVRKQHPELAQAETDEYRSSQLARSGYVSKYADGEGTSPEGTYFHNYEAANEAHEEIERLALLLMEGDSTLNIVIARNTVRQQRPDLAAKERGYVEVPKSLFVS